MNSEQPFFVRREAALSWERFFRTAFMRVYLEAGTVPG
jgi:hypothetical protein